MTGVTGAPPQLPNEIAGWVCDWQAAKSNLELVTHRTDRRGAAIGEALAGRIIVRRQQSGWEIEARLWVLEDIAEHQRLRVRRGSATTPGEIHDFLVDAGLPRELAISVAEAAASLSLPASS